MGYYASFRWLALWAKIAKYEGKIECLVLYILLKIDTSVDQSWYLCGIQYFIYDK